LRARRQTAHFGKIEEEEVKRVKRILTVLVVALIMAAMVVAMVMPAFAAITLQNPGGNTPQGGGANNGQAIEAVNPAGHAPPGQNQ